MSRVVVVGGGVSGLAAAHALVERGGGYAGTRGSGGAAADQPVEVLCFEAGYAAGGSVRTETHEGFLLESGPMGFREASPGTRALIDRLDLAPRKVVADSSASGFHVFRAGKLRRLPRSSREFVACDILPAGARLRVLAEPLARRGTASDDESIESFAMRRLGKNAGTLLADALTTALCAGDSRRMSMRSAFPKLHSMESNHGSLFRALRTAAPGRERATLGSFVSGLEELTQSLADRLGDRLRLGVGVCAVSGMGERGFRVLPEHGLPLDADAVILACPASDAAAVIGDWDPHLGRALEGIAAARVVRVHLGYSEAAIQPWPGGAGFVVPRDQGLRMLGTAWTSSLFPGRAPARSRLLTVTFGGSRDPAALDLDDRALIDMAKADLGVALGLIAAPHMARVVRPPAGIPQYEIGHTETLARLDRRLGRRAGLYLSGCSYRGLELSACIDEASQIAETVVKQLPRQPVAVC